MTNWPVDLPYPAVGTWPETRYRIECSNSWIYWELQRCPWNGHGKSLLRRGETGGMPADTLAWYYLSGLRFFTSLMISIIMAWCPLSKISAHATEWGPQKCFQSGPALAKAGPAHKRMSSLMGLTTAN